MRQYIFNCLLLALVFIFQNSDALHAQSSDACPEAQTAIDKFNKIDEEYRKIQKDLAAGLYCSRCNYSKTEIERGGNETFDAHLRRVEGTAIPAPQSLIDQKHKDYLSKRNYQKDMVESAIKRCEEKAEREREAKIAEEKRKQEQAQREREAAQEEAEQKAKEEEERKKREEEDRRQKEQERLDELKRQKEQMEAELRQRRLELAGGLLNSFQQSVAQKAQEYQQMVDDFNQNLSKYTAKAVGVASDVWDNTKYAMQAETVRQVKKTLSETTLDEEDFDQAVSIYETIKKGLDEGWDKVRPTEFFSALGVERALPFGQMNGVRAAEEAGFHTVSQFLDFLTQSVNGDMSVEEVLARSDEILREAGIRPARNFLNNSFPFVQLGDLLLGKEK